MNLPRVRMVLEAVLDKVSGEAGSGAALTANTQDGVASQFEALALALQSATGTEMPAAAEGQQFRSTLGAAGLSADHIPARGYKGGFKPNKGSALAAYEELRSQDPAAAGRFYADNADKIADGFAARTRAEAADRRARLARHV